MYSIIEEERFDLTLNGNILNMENNKNAWQHANISEIYICLNKLVRIYEFDSNWSRKKQKLMNWKYASIGDLDQNVPLKRKIINKYTYWFMLHPIVC